MRRTFSLWASRAWRVHSELIQGWIAGASSEPRQLQQIRSYLNDLKLDDALEEVEDATDLVYFMHRASYPAGSHLETRVEEFLSELSGQVTREHLLEIGRRLNEQPGSGPLWSRIVFEQPWFSERVVDVLEMLTLEEHITFCAAIWRSLFFTRQRPSSRHATQGAAVAVSQQLAMLTAQRIERGDAGAAICLCAQLGIPLQEEGLTVLRDLLLSRTRDCALSPEQAIALMGSLLLHYSTDTEWLDALQTSMCKKSSRCVGVPQAVGLLRAMRILRFSSISKDFEGLLLRLLPDMSPEDILESCRYLASFPNAAPRLRDDFQKTLQCTLTPSNDSFDNRDNDALLWKLHGLSLIAPTEASALLSLLASRLKDTDSAFPPATTQILVRCMRELQVFPPELVSYCKKSFFKNASHSFTQEDSAYLLYTAAHTGEPVDGVFFKEVLNRFAATRKFDRRKHKTYHENFLSFSALTMVLESFCVAKKGKVSLDPKVYAMIRDAIMEQQGRPEGVSVDDAIYILKLLLQLEVSDGFLTTSLLTRVAKSISSMTPTHVKSFSEVLVGLNSRDVLMFRALLSHLSRISPDHEIITSMAFTARKLKFIPYFQQSALVEHVISIDSWSLSDIVLVASVCSEKQRETLLSLPGAEKLYRAQPEELTTLDLFLLLSMSGDDADKITVITSTLRSRPPLAAGDLEVEDVRRAFVRVANDKEALAAVCRSGAATMQTVDETMLMRFLEAASNAPDLPNVFFRVVGKAVLQLASSMTVENAMRWLQLYVKYQIRDDSVGKALLSKGRTRSQNAAALVDKTIRKAATMYGKSYVSQGKTKKNKEKVEWYSFNSV